MKNIIKKYWQKANFAASILSIVPYIRFIGVNGSLAKNKINRKSDIDFLIFTKNSRIWTCRFFCIILLKLFGLKTGKNRSKYLICLNRFQCESYLEIIPHEYYTAYNYSSTTPIFDINNLFYKFKKENKWMIRYVKFPEISAQKIKCNLFTHKTRIFFEWILNSSVGNWFEKKLKTYQVSKIIKNPLITPGEGVIIVNDNMVCFHPKSKGKKIIYSIKK